MTAEEIGNFIQLAAVLTAVGASIAALAIAASDRRTARQIAHEDRRVAVQQARLMFEWEAAKRLSVLEARGGHTDPAIVKDMGAETLALIALLGPDRVPGMWNRRVGKTDSDLRAFIADETKEQFLRDAVEAERAVHDIGAELTNLASGR